MNRTTDLLREFLLTLVLAVGSSHLAAGGEESDHQAVPPLQPTALFAASLALPTGSIAHATTQHDIATTYGEPGSQPILLDVLSIDTPDGIAHQVRMRIVATAKMLPNGQFAFACTQATVTQPVGETVGYQEIPFTGYSANSSKANLQLVEAPAHVKSVTTKPSQGGEVESKPVPIELPKNPAADMYLAPSSVLPLGTSLQVVLSAATEIPSPTTAASGPASAFEGAPIDELSKRQHVTIAVMIFAFALMLAYLIWNESYGSACMLAIIPLMFLWNS